MKSITGKDFCKTLERHGWTLLRVNGSHHIFGHADRRERISVPVHAGKSLKPGLLLHFLKQAGMEQSDI
ncbi:MAG: type II toxin-antitoxin system HicA family toxin [Fimbriimonadales bacterium]